MSAHGSVFLIDNIHAQRRREGKGSALYALARCRVRVVAKGVGPNTTFAWPGRKQPDISVKVDRHDSKQAGSIKVV
jgi:hypothetical protein